VSVAWKMRKHRAYRRLGYRTQGVYALEELGISGRTFRALASLGERLAELPQTRVAYVRGEISSARAGLIASVASPENEELWLQRARRLGVGGLEKKAFEVKALEVEALEAKAQEDCQRSKREGEDGPDGFAGPAVSGSVDSPSDLVFPGGAQSGRSISAGGEGEDRQRHCFAIPGWELGKAEAVSELASRVAGSDLPPGTRWEMIAAEFLSGAEASLAEGGEAATGEEEARAGELESMEEEHASLEAGDDGSRSGTTCISGDGFLLGQTHRSMPRVFHLSRCVPVLPEESGEDRGASHQNEHSADVGSECQETGKAAERQPGVEAASEKDTPWQLHRSLIMPFGQERQAAALLGRPLRILREQALWRELAFGSFDQYVRDRLGISPRVAHRLIRLERQGNEHPALMRAYQQGELTLLKAELLLRVFRLGISPDAEKAWVEYALRMTFRRLSEAIRWAEGRDAKSRTVDGTVRWARADGMPPAENLPVAPGSDGEWWSAEPAAGCTDALPTFATSDEDIGHRSWLESYLLKPYPDAWAAQAVTAELVIWMEEGEKELLDRAIEVVRKIRGPSWPLWACLNDLMDHFLAVYDSAQFRALKERYPLFARDAWRCQAPGCNSYSGLHRHHIRFRGQGGGDESQNLVVVCELCRYRHKSHYAERRIMPRGVDAASGWRWFERDREVMKAA